jgi:hypothetical protein
MSYAPDWPKRPIAEISMLQRAHLVQQPRIALRETLDAQEPAKPRMFARAFIDRVLRLWRVLSQFVAAGGPLS